MTEDSGEAHADGDKAFAENNKKRRLKTPVQVMALENFYNEHKYPTEEMKAKLGEEIGLTEKQVSGWFCHRRLKDKRSLKDEGNTIGRQDRSSVVIQDRGSGHRQDSCGSTKQTDYRNPEPREVESQRLYTSQYRLKVDGGDSTSSESSSSLHDQHVSGKDGLYDMETSRHVTHNGAMTLLEPQVMRNLGYRPSGYLKVKGEIENAAITAVKRQLGRHYCEDGPPLGVEFDPLPPGAFESLSTDVVHEPVYVGNQRWSHSPYSSAVRKHPNPGPRYDVHNSKTHSLGLGPYLEDENDDATTVGVGPGSRDRKVHQQLRQKSPSDNYPNPFSNHKSLLETHIGSTLETSLFKSKKSRVSSKPGAEGLIDNPLPNCHDLYGGNLEMNHNSLHDNDNSISKMAYKSGCFSKPPNPVLMGGKSPDTMERGPSSGMVKPVKLHGGRNPAKVHRGKMHLTDESLVTKRAKDNYHKQGYATKAPYDEALGRRNHIKGFGVEVPSSFSEDETAETGSGSSMD